MANSSVHLVGNLTADPILRTTGKGTPVVNFDVAVSEGTKDNQETGFYSITAWDSLAQNVADSLKKGNRVIVSGVLKTGTWTTKDGENRSKVQVTADAVGPDLRWSTASVVGNSRPAVAPAQLGYPSDEEWAAQRAAQGDKPVVSDEPF
jgi:single-strand DNA-binding protein